jgi:hypothetical protein
LDGDGEDVLPCFTSAYCNPDGVVTKSRFGRTVDGGLAAFVIVEKVVRARSGE